MIIDSVGKYLQTNGKIARIVHIEGGWAFGFTEHRSPCRWLCISGRGVDSGDITGPYHEPPPKPAVDPGEGWRLLDDDEPVEQGDEFLSNSAGWVTSNNWEYAHGRFQADGFPYRRRINMPEPLPEWTPTNEWRDRKCENLEEGVSGRVVDGMWRTVLREQKWVCGDKVEWRVPPLVEESTNART